MIDKGFFDIARDCEVILGKNLPDAQQYCLNKVDEFRTECAGVKPSNIRKAQAMILKARTSRDLAIAVKNFVLAHPSEDLAVM